MTPRILAVLLAALPLAAPLRAAHENFGPGDPLAPVISNILVGDCNGTLQSNVLITDTGTPNIQLTVQDPVPTPSSQTASGLKVGRSSMTGGGFAMRGTVLLLDFDEPDGTLTATDRSGDSNHAQFPAASGGACPGPNPCRESSMPGFGKRLKFSGPGGRLRIPVSGSLTSTTDQFTIEAWIRIEDANPHLLLEWDDGISSGPMLWTSLNAPGQLFANFIDTFTLAPHVVQSTPSALQLDTDHLIAATYDGNVGRLFVDGVQVASQALGGFNVYVTTDLFIGGRTRDSASFTGSIDQLRILKLALPASTLEMDYYAGKLKVSTAGAAGPFRTAGFADPDPSFAPPLTNGVSGPVVLSTAVALPPGPNNLIQLWMQDRSGNNIVQSLALEVRTHPPGTPSLTVEPASTGSIRTSWTKPSLLCAGPTARLYSCSSAVPLFSSLALAPSGGSREEPVAGGPNVLTGRRVSAVDAFGESSLSACTSAYTDAAPPGNISPGIDFRTSSISTGSMALEWGADGNPSYTRYELGRWDAGFATFLSSPILLADNYTSTRTALAGLLPSTTYFWRVRAHNGRLEDPFGSRFTAAVSTAVPTLPSSPPGLGGAALGISSIAWTWGQVPTALAYTLRTSTGGLLFDGGKNGFTQGGLTANSPAGVLAFTRNQSGSSAASAALTRYTLADAPVGAAAASASSSAVTLSWGTAANPAGTVYEVSLATDAAFTTVLGTRSATAAGLQTSGLLPSTTYFFRIRALNGDGVPSGFASPVSARTAAAPSVTFSTAPPTPYVPSAGTVGLWHFDEGAGAAAADSSGLGNHGALACLGAGCASTPTFAAAPALAGLGAAARFSGIQDGLVAVPHSASLNSAGSLSVEAWVHPTTSLQVSSAGLAAKGDFGDEAFALDLVSAGGSLKPRLVLRDAGGALSVVTSSRAIPVNTWTHVAGVYDQAGLSMSLYVDGSLSKTEAGPASRRANGHRLSIGGRQAGAGPYDLPFAGLLDEVHLHDRALSAAEVAAAFSSARPSTVSLASPAAPVRVVLPANAFGAAATLYVSSDPLSSPLDTTRAPSVLADALAAPPTDFAQLVPGSLTEVLATVGGAAFSGNLGSPAILHLPYPDADGNGLVDGTLPPIEAARLEVFTLNASAVRWEKLVRVATDASGRSVSALTPHFSIFALFGATRIRPDLDRVTLYPVPWKPGSGGRFDSAEFNGRKGLLFDNLPASGSIRIFTLAGEKVAELPFSAADGGRRIWDGHNSAGRSAASGVYFAVVSSDSERAVLKLAIER